VQTFTEAAQLSLFTNGETAVVQLNPAVQQYRQQAEEFGAGLLIHAYRFFTKRNITPVEVRFRHSRRDKLREVTRFFGCRVKYQQKHLQIALKLLEEAQQEAAKLNKPERPRTATQKTRPAQRWHGPTEQTALPRIALCCELDEADRACPQCGDRLEPLAGEAERSEMIDVVELKYQVVEVERKKYVCGCGGAVETAPGPARAVEGGRYSLRFAIKVAFDLRGR